MSIGLGRSKYKKYTSFSLDDLNKDLRRQRNIHEHRKRIKRDRETACCNRNTARELEKKEETERNDIHKKKCSQHQWILRLEMVYRGKTTEWKYKERTRRKKIHRMKNVYISFMYGLHFGHSHITASVLECECKRAECGCSKLFSFARCWIACMSFSIYLQPIWNSWREHT